LIWVSPWGGACEGWAGRLQVRRLGVTAAVVSGKGGGTRWRRLVQPTPVAVAERDDARGIEGSPRPRRRRLPCVFSSLSLPQNRIAGTAGPMNERFCSHAQIWCSCGRIRRFRGRKERRK
ncbi:hypothetical protein EJB05_26394, partial [Eragrostis curvula]